MELREASVLINITLENGTRQITTLSICHCKNEYRTRQLHFIHTYLTVKIISHLCNFNSIPTISPILGIKFI
jgi:hypothetical protein